MRGPASTSPGALVIFGSGVPCTMARLPKLQSPPTQLAPTPSAMQSFTASQRRPHAGSTTALAAQAGASALKHEVPPVHVSSAAQPLVHTPHQHSSPGPQLGVSVHCRNQFELLPALGASSCVLPQLASQTRATSAAATN